MEEKIGVIIPCYNVETTIEKVLMDISEKTLAKVSNIICIDNDSKDNTRKVLEQIKNKKKVLSEKIILIYNSENYGYGGNIKIASRYCLDNKFTFITIVHSDNQSSSNEILNNFFSEFETHPDCDIILASRVCNRSNLKGYSILRILGNYFFNSLTYLITGLKMSDAGTAIIFCRTNVLKKIPYNTLTNGYQFHPELNIFIYKDKTLKIREIPLTWKNSEVKNHLNLFKYGRQLLVILFRYLLHGRIFKKQDKDVFYKKENSIDFSCTVQ